MIKRIIFIALAALGLAACAKQELSVETRVPEKLTASMEEFTSKTKVQLNQEMKTVWTEGDQLTVFYKNEQNDCWQFDGQTGDRNGTFSRVSVEEIAAPTLKDAFIVYPYAEGTTFEAEQNRITIEIPSVQTYTEGSYAPGSNIMFAKTQSERFTMKNLTGYVMFQLKGDQKVKSIKLTGKQQENVSGAAYISTENELIDYIDDMNNTDEVETRAGSDTSKELVLDCGEGVQLDKNTATTFYLALVPRVFQEGFEIEIECTNGFTLTKSTKGSFAIRRNTVYKMKEFDVNPNAEDVPLTPEAIFKDVSEGGKANSYIITSDGYYKFPAVKGNTDQEVGEVAKVEVLWESFGTDKAPKKRDLISALDYFEEENHIYFEATEKEGNALIAAKDANGEILWSWHIWMTDKPKDQEYLNGAGELMDRNLGATSANPADKEKTFGLLYQYGRKDPFIGKINADDRAESTLENWPNVSVEITEGKIGYSINNPTTFITADFPDAKWMTDESITLWGNEKTIYDPCPAGYRVPEGGDAGIWARAFGSSTIDELTGLYDWTNIGFLFNTTNQYALSSVQDVWYPMHAILYYTGDLAYDGICGYVWGYGDFPVEFGYGYYSNINQCWVSLNAESRQACGNAVRCFKEGSAVDPTPVDLSKVDDNTSETANSYIVTNKGFYKFPMMKGNSTDPVVNVAKVEVLWESFGTDEAINKGNLVPRVSFEEDYINFYATGKKGNALIAAKDANGEILWSWHIWMTDQPKDQKYKNGAGTMMDRNLGATSADPEDEAKTFGLLYEWGRKDPFVGQTKIGLAKSTLSNWPAEFVETTPGNIDFSIKHPTTFIFGNSGGRWTLEENVALWEINKTMYDPCPPGYQVPDGSESGIWARAFEEVESFNTTGLYNQIHNGFYFSRSSEYALSASDDVWYPSVTVLRPDGFSSHDLGGGVIWGYGYDGENEKYVSQDFILYHLDTEERVYPTEEAYPAYGVPVRCYKEGSAQIRIPEDTFDLSKEDESSSSSVTANSYIVTMGGDYMFPMVKGNSTDPVVNVDKVEVLWESYGTDETITTGDLVSGVCLAEDKYIVFHASNKKGNALIAAKDAEGKILWSWHIWMTERPKDQEYRNGAGTMMDRNLGATSAKPEDKEKTFGLLYQWGRKDPFVGQTAIGIVQSTLGEWPRLDYNQYNIDLDFISQYPTSFVYTSSYNVMCWLQEYQGNASEIDLWGSAKTIYDPCPPGYQVPDGSNNGIWARALGQDVKFTKSEYFDLTNKGLLFKSSYGQTLSTSSDVWYPFIQYIDCASGDRKDSSSRGLVWAYNRDASTNKSVTFMYYCVHLAAEDMVQGTIIPKEYQAQAYGLAVRCYKTGSAVVGEDQ